MKWHEKNEDLFHSEQHYIRQNQPDLHFREQNGLLYLIGMFTLDADYNGYRIRDKYAVEIEFPPTYPNDPPRIKETEGKIAKDFHRNLLDGTLCLGANADVYWRFLQNPCIANYLENIVTHYLYAHAYFKKFKVMRWGDLQHKEDGILQYYRELFRIQERLAIAELIAVALNLKTSAFVAAEEECPCGSGEVLKECHGEVVDRLRQVPKRVLRYDLYLLDGSRVGELVLPEYLKRPPRILFWLSPH